MIMKSLRPLAVPGAIVAIALLLDFVSGAESGPATAIVGAALGALGVAVTVVLLGNAATIPALVPLASWLAVALAVGSAFVRRFVPPVELDVMGLLGFAAIAAVALIAMASTLEPGRRARRIALRTGALVLLFSGVFAGLEALARRMVPIDPYAIVPEADSASPDYARADPVLGFRAAPGFRGRFVHPEYGRELVTLGAQGFRGGDVPAEKPPGERRVFVLGDSLTFGLGVEDGETFASLLGKGLGPGYRAVNAGLPGFGTFHELVLFGDTVAPLSPDLVVVAFYAGNDLDDNETRVRKLERAGLLEDHLALGEAFREGSTSGRRGGRARKEEHAERQTNPLPIRRAYWERSSALFRLVAGRIDAFLVARGFADAPLVYNWSFLQALEKKISTAAKREYGLTGEILSALRERVEKAGARLALVVIPVKIQCEPAAFEKLCRQFNLKPERFDADQAGRLVVEMARERGIPAFDTLPLLRAATESGEEPFFREGHLSRRGHEIVARALLEFLEREGLE